VVDLDAVVSAAAGTFGHLGFGLREVFQAVSSVHMAHLTYQRAVVGYHGCDAAVAERVLAGKAGLGLSTNPYDWLGEGVYFWEHGPQRAYEWAIEQARLGGEKVRIPSVLAAKINLGVCLDLLDIANTRLLGWWYARFRRFMRQNGIRMPKNRAAAGSRCGERLLRFRDRAVIDYTVSRLADSERIRYQTVRGVFLEGGPAFPGSEIALKSHIQIAVRDRECIAKFFRPDSGDYRSDP
jgi:hypothetical protein